EFEVVGLQRVLDYQLVPVAEVVSSVDPAELCPVSVGYQEPARSQIVGGHLSDDPVLDRQASVLDRVQVFVAGGKNKMMLLFWIDVFSVHFQDRFHETVDQESSPPPLKREIQAVLQLAPCLDPSPRQQANIGHQFGSVLPASVGRLGPGEGPIQVRRNENDEIGCRE